MLRDLEFFHSVVTDLLEAEKDEPVSEYIDIDELNQLDLSLGKEAMSEDAWRKAVSKLILSTPRTASTSFFNQLFGGRQSKAVVGDLLAVMLNNSMYTYKVAGPQVGVEMAIVRKLCELIGFPQNAGGTFASGGSMANLMSIIMARDAFDPEIRMTGIQPEMMAYTSEESHYSIAKNASFIGMGRNNLRKVESDDQGRMKVDHLRELVEEDLANGLKPFFVNATAGTTVLGSYDPFDGIADICERHSLWLHIDGAWGGSAFLSEKYKFLVEGKERANSYSFNAHKMLGTPLTCSVILVKDKHKLTSSFASDAEYLYQTASDEFNLGKTSLQCGRRNDALKFWTLWKAVGTEGLEKIIDRQFQLAEFAQNYVEGNPDYQVYSFENSASVCFNYKGISARELCTKLYEESELMVGYGQSKGEEFVRLVIVNANLQEKDIEAFFEKLESFVTKHEDLILDLVEENKS